MTQEEKWLRQWQTVMVYMAENHRRPSKFVDEERDMRNWWKHQQKLLNAGGLREERIPLFKELLERGEEVRRKNQWE